MPPSVVVWLPEKHLRRFVVAVVESLDLLSIVLSYPLSSSSSHHPLMLFLLFFYLYSTLLFSILKLERATSYSLSFPFISSNYHPFLYSISSFLHLFFSYIYYLFFYFLPFSLYILFL